MLLVVAMTTNVDLAALSGQPNDDGESQYTLARSSNGNKPAVPPGQAKRDPSPSEPAPEPQPVDTGGLTRSSIGDPSPSGSLLYQDGSYRLSGAGGDIWSTADSFEFGHRSVSGDASLIVHVAEQTDTNAWAKAGLMFRHDESRGSRHVSLFVTPANGVAFQYRSDTGGSSTHVAGPRLSAPSWLRLDRIGDTFEGYSSADGKSWEPIGSTTVPLAETALVGLAVTSHNDGTLSTAEFTDFDIGSGPGDSSRSEPAPEPEPEPAPEPEPEPAPEPEPGPAPEPEPEPAPDPEPEPAPDPEPEPAPDPEPEPAPDPEPEPAPDPEPSPDPEPFDPAPTGGLERSSIGSPSPAGSLTHQEGTYTLAGAGKDIWETSDAFEFAHRDVNGDISLVTRVTSQTNTHAWAKAGLMIRSDDSPGAQHVSVFQTPANGVALQYRSTAGATSLHIPGPATSAPTWLRLDRVGNSFTAYSSDDGVNWRAFGTITAAVAASALAGLAVTSHADGSLSTAEFTDLQFSEIPEMPVDAEPVAGGKRFLYPEADVVRYQASMSKPGPYYAMGDAGHGGPYSPPDGQRAVQWAGEFLANPQASYWVHPDWALPYWIGYEGTWPHSTVYVKPMHAAWVYMTQPQHPHREALRREVKALLLHHANHYSHDYSNSTNYPANFPGYAPSPIFGTSAWMTRLIKARDMLGRDSFTAQENAVLDQWFYDYSNWTFKWLHLTGVGRWVPGRLNRDYSVVHRPANAYRKSYDGGPLIGDMAMNYTNRHSAPASAASLAANYLKYHGYVAPRTGGPSYGRFTVDELLEHSRLFVEETIRFSVYPQGLQGDFERGDSDWHSTASPQRGWLYSANVLINLVEIAAYHAKRGDMSVWDYGTTAGYDGTAGVPVAGGFKEKNIHFFAWSMSRYVNDGWKRTNRGQPLALPHYYHDVLPAATVARFVPDDTLLRDAWRRSGSGFPPYAERPETQGIWHAHQSEGATAIGLIEQAGASRLDNR
jgi:regulation of enolase protein 1 (concanavalin A-like superfamily)